MNKRTLNTIVLVMHWAMTAHGQVPFPWPADKQPIVQYQQESPANKPPGAATPRWIFTITFPAGAAGAYYVDHFQFAAVASGIFDPTYDSSMFIYSRNSGPNGAFTLFSDAPTIINTPQTGPWSNWTNNIPVGNSQCKVWTQDSVTSTPNGNLVVTVPIEVTSLMEGAYKIYLEHGSWISNTSDNFNGLYVYSNWKPLSTFLNLPTKSLSPGSGTGANPVFEAIMSSTGGAGNGIKAINRALFIVNTGNLPNGVNACYGIWHRTNKKLDVIDQTGNGTIGSSYPIDPLPNSANGSFTGNNCTMNTGMSTYSEAGTAGVLTISTIFTPSFTGPKNVFIVPIDRAGQSPTSNAPDGTWNSTQQIVAPVITFVNPQGGPPSTSVTIYGQNFGLLSGS